MFNFFLIFPLIMILPVNLKAQESYREILKSFIESKISVSGDKDWYLEVEGVKLSKEPLKKGLEVLDQKLKTSTLSKNEKKELRSQFVQNYIDRMAILILTYKEFLEETDLDSIFLDFLAQSATQKYIDRQLASNPDAIKPTEADIDQYYNQNSSRYRGLGLSMAQIRELAMMELSQTKAQAWTEREIIKIRTQAKILTNKQVQKELGL
ncbi:MAG: hypothetical protein ACRC9L_05400 [Brevinema sp.]